MMKSRSHPVDVCYSTAGVFDRPPSCVVCNQLPSKWRQDHKNQVPWTYAKRFHPDHPKGEFKQAGLHFFPKCNDVHWYLIIVDFDQKIIFSVDSYGDVDHEKDATVMLTFFRLALLKKRAATRQSSRRDTFMLQGNFKAMDWGYRRLPVPLAYADRRIQFSVVFLFAWI